MNSAEESDGDQPRVTVEVAYRSSGRVIRVVGPATSKLFDWIREIDAAEEVQVVIGPVEDLPG